MKYKEIQVLDSFGVLSVFIALGLCVVVIAPVWNSSQSENFEKTMRRAENLAYQIIEARHGSHSARGDGEGRAPASELELSHLQAETGKIGSDLWGNPFHFKIIQRDQARSQIAVWSGGANGKSETSDEGLDSGQDVQFGGDDIGAILSIN